MIFAESGLFTWLLCIDRCIFWLWIHKRSTCNETSSTVTEFSPKFQQVECWFCVDPQNAEYSPKTNNPQCWYGAEKILKSPSVRALQWILKFCQNKGVCWYFSTYGVFYSLIINRKRFALCVLCSLSQLASFALFAKSQNRNFAQILFCLWIEKECF